MKLDTRPLERVVEGAVVKYAKGLGVLSYKLNGMGQRSWPDRMFLHEGCIMFVEFKRLGEKPTPKQTLNHEMLRNAGFNVKVVDNKEAGLSIIKNWAGCP